MINRTPYFLDKDTFMASYVIGSQCVDYNRGNVDNCVRKERSSKFLGMEGRTPLKMQSSSDQVIPPTNSKVAHPIHRPAILEPNFFFLHIILQIFPLDFLLSPNQYLQHICLQRSVYQKNSYSPNIELCIIKHKSITKHKHKILIITNPLFQLMSNIVEM